MKQFKKIREIHTPIPLSKLFVKAEQIEVEYKEKALYGVFCLTARIGETIEIKTSRLVGIRLTECTGVIYDEINNCFVYGRVEDV